MLSVVIVIKQKSMKSTISIWNDDDGWMNEWMNGKDVE